MQFVNKLYVANGPSHIHNYCVVTNIQADLYFIILFDGK